MKIAVISPSFPPYPCGVGDYSHQLTLAFSQLEQEICVWRKDRDLKFVSTPFKQIPVLEKDFPADLISLAAFTPDQILIQYTPYLHAQNRYGIALRLLGWLKHLKAHPTLSKIPVSLYFHEQHYPVLPTLRGVLVGLPQAYVFREILRLCDHAIYSTQANLEKYQALHASSHCIAVGSNIEITAPLQTSVQKPAPARLLLFGSNHPTRMTQWAYLALKQSLQLGFSTQLRVIGSDPSGPHFVDPEIAPHIVRLGYLSAAEVSKELRQAQLALAPFLEGVSTRRGSAVAAFAHGLPLVTTLGSNSMGSVPWEEIAITAEPQDQAFASAVTGALQNTEAASRTAERALHYYQNFLTWPYLATQFLEIWK